MINSATLTAVIANCHEFGRKLKKNIAEAAEERKENVFFPPLLKSKCKNTSQRREGERKEGRNKASQEITWHMSKTMRNKRMNERANEWMNEWLGMCNTPNAMEINI